MNRSLILAVLIGIGLFIWLSQGTITVQGQAAPASSEPAADPAEPAEKPRIKVQVKTLSATPIQRELVLQGQLEAQRVVELKAETDGRLLRWQVEQGERLAKGVELLQLSQDQRPALLQQAKVQLAQAEKDLQALRTLNKRGLQAETQLLAAQSDLAVARANLKAIQVDLAHTRLKAPFAGLLNERLQEVGAFVQRGEPIAVFVDDSSLKMTAQVSQHSVDKLKIGQQVQADLLNGKSAAGEIRYISAIADPQTRSYRVEIRVPNPEQRLRAGASVTLRIPLGETPAHFISAALLSLSTEGVLGVKAVDADDQVTFHPIQRVRAENGGIWVSGLPEHVQVITLGQGFVRAGQIVETHPKTGEDS